MSPLLLPAGLPARIAFEARAAGARVIETGGFILGAPDAPASVLALTGEMGITRRRDLFHVTGLALATLFEWVEERDLTVAAQWHTHGRHAFLSETDLEHGFNVPGFTTTVVPYYRQASPDPADWGWWRFNGDKWVAVPAPSLVSSEFSAITFEEGHVDEH
jgi:hypothetical protein